MKKILAKLFNDNKNIVGLDLGLGSIKFMELSGDDLEHVKLEGYATMPIPPELLNENGEFKTESIPAISEIVNKCWKKAGCSTKNVAFNIKGNTVISKKSSIPAFSDAQDLKTAIESEISKYIPNDLSLEDLMIDYFTIGPNENNPNENDTLIVASKKEKIDELQAIIEGAGLIPEILDVDLFAYQNMLKLMKSDEFETGTYVLADCSAHMLRVFVFINGELVATKETQIGGVNLTYDIVNNLGVSFEEAERLKIERNGDETYDLIEKSFINNYKTEFLSVLTYFTSATSLGEIDEIILTGGVASIPYLEQAIIDGLLESPDIIVKSEPYVAKPLEKAQKNAKVNLTKYSEDEPSLFLVTSLALRKYLRQF